MAEKQLKLLIIESNPADSLMLMGLLSEIKSPVYYSEQAIGFQPGLEMLGGGGYSLVFLDIALAEPKLSEAVLKVHARSPNIPVILLVPRDKEHLGVKGMREGAQDYLVRGRIDAKTLEKTIGYAIERQSMLFNLELKNRELQRMSEIKSEFISMVSHEIRTPLTIMKEFVSIMLDEVHGKVNKDQREYLTIVENNINRLTLIINDLLDISKIEDGKLKLFKAASSLSVIIKNSVESFEAKADAKKIKLEYVPSPQLPRVFVDPDRITQVLVNLIGNAIKFTPEGGSVTVEASEKDKFIAASITDTGPGIAAEHFDRIFDRFEQVGRKAGGGPKGTGLGLTIARKIIELHGGKIWVESPPAPGKKGSKFCFLLPQYDPEAIFRERLSEILQKVKKTGSVLSLITVKIDEFDILKKSVTTGEAHGILQELKDIAAGLIRETDEVVVHYDKGMVFVILPDCSAEVAESINGRVREQLYEYTFSLARFSQKIALLTGRASYPQDAKNEAELAAFAADNLQAVQSHMHRILVVDDEEEVFELLRDMYTRRGHEVEVATDGNKAVSMFREKKYDLVFLDLMLPGKNGADVLRELKGLNPEVRVIVVTAYPDSDLFFKAMKLSPLTVIAKPFNMEQLDELTRKLI